MFFPISMFIRVYYMYYSIIYFWLKFGLMNSFAIPNLSLIYICISKTFKTLKTVFRYKITIWIRGCVLQILKSWIVVQKFVLNISIKAFWYRKEIVSLFCVYLELIYFYIILKSAKYYCHHQNTKWLWCH